MRDEAAYFRVRTAAAASLGTMANETTSFASLRALVRYVREVHFDGPHLRPNDFSDLAGYAVLKAVVEALGTCRDAGGCTPPEAVDLLLEMIDDNDNACNAFSDGWVPCRPPHPHTGPPSAERARMAPLPTAPI